MGRTTKQLLAVALLFGTAAIAMAGAGAQPDVNVSKDGVAIEGYDAISYISEGRPLQGSTRFETRWNGAVWRFTSAAHRDTFLADPARYAPQFGGYCAYAVSQGHTANGDPLVWKVVDGRLYLNYSTSVQRTWEKDVPGYIAEARANWPGVLNR